ncbi:recombinase family protein [Lederbergia wuyishanensis]|uniref:Site-specific DNA recombinase n=1 Tax=Lederbergia wuyishanensis TaxID=1347903 RepID=A0ABU0D4K9_9BACI|nr:recombinase family protein [Lederbergia wuyishanensis]MCJ8008086.1 recombinase family protein [Lederbergia wuyishanensis]MDQ0343329.1 site-specific DNA recombinase [Lederbergia wuyishanensis]
MNTVIYIRVSTEEQAKHGYSIAAQKEKLEAFCVSQGWKISNTYIDDGFSAKDLNRPKFNMMLDEIKKGNVDVLLVYRLDRLTRSVLDLYTILKVLDEHNCSFKSATEVYDTTNAMGRLFITLVAAIAQWERENTAERVRLGMEKKTKLGIWKGGTAPYGYKVVNKELVVNPDEVDLVKTIFSLSRTYGFLTVAKKLNTMNFDTRKGGDWHVDSVRTVANNPVYAGYLTFNESPKTYRKPASEQTLYEAVHERIISREEFWELQDILEKRRMHGGKNQTSNYYFSTILKCGRCGSSLSGHKGGRGEKTYRCSGKKSGKNCTSHIIKEDTLVKKIFSVFDDLVGDFIGSSNVSDYSFEKISELENELKSIQKLLEKQKTLYKHDIIDIDELIKETETLREREKEITQELKTIKNSNKHNKEEIETIVENIDSLWTHANDYERKQIMTTLFNQIVIDTENEYQRGTGVPREIIIVSAK